VNVANRGCADVEEDQQAAQAAGEVQDQADDVEE
jgi:hypothetical protein